MRIVSFKALVMPAKKGSSRKSGGSKGDSKSQSKVGEKWKKDLPKQYSK